MANGGQAHRRPIEAPSAEALRAELRDARSAEKALRQQVKRDEERAAALEQEIVRQRERVAALEQQVRQQREGHDAEQGQRLGALSRELDSARQRAQAAESLAGTPQGPGELADRTARQIARVLTPGIEAAGEGLAQVQKARPDSIARLTVTARIDRLALGDLSGTLCDRPLRDLVGDLRKVDRTPVVLSLHPQDGGPPVVLGLLGLGSCAAEHLGFFAEVPEPRQADQDLTRRWQARLLRQPTLPAKAIDFVGVPPSLYTLLGQAWPRLASQWATFRAGWTGLVLGQESGDLTEASWAPTGTVRAKLDTMRMHSTLAALDSQHYFPGDELRIVLLVPRRRATCCKLRLEALPAGAEAIHAHLPGCVACRKDPLHLCPTGAALLQMEVSHV